MSEQISIHQQWRVACESMANVPHEGHQPRGNYSYPTISDVRDAAALALERAALAWRINMLAVEQRPHFHNADMTQTLLHFEVVITNDQGDSITAQVWGEGDEKGSKGIAKALSNGLKAWIIASMLPPGTPSEDVEDEPIRQATNGASSGAVVPTTKQGFFRQAKAQFGLTTEQTADTLKALGYDRWEDVENVPMAFAQLAAEVSAWMG